MCVQVSPLKVHGQVDSPVPRPSSTSAFGGPGMPNQFFERVGPIGNVFAHSVTMTTFWEHPQQLTVCWRSQELLPSLVSGCQVELVVRMARCPGSPDGASCCWTA